MDKKECARSRTAKKIKHSKSKECSSALIQNRTRGRNWPCQTSQQAICPLGKVPARLFACVGHKIYAGAASRLHTKMALVPSASAPLKSASKV